MKNLKIFLAGFYRTISRIYIYIYIYLFISSLFYFIWIYRRLTREIVMEGGSFVKISFRLLMIEWEKVRKFFTGRTVYQQRMKEEGRGSFNGTFIV